MAWGLMYSMKPFGIENKGGNKIYFSITRKAKKFIFSSPVIWAGKDALVSKIDGVS